VTALYCEICDKSPAKERVVWTVCSGCAEVCKTFLQLVEEHNVDSKHLEPLKEVLRAAAKDLGLVK